MTIYGQGTIREKADNDQPLLFSSHYAGKSYTGVKVVRSHSVGGSSSSSSSSSSEASTAVTANRVAMVNAARASGSSRSGTRAANGSVDVVVIKGANYTAVGRQGGGGGGYVHGAAGSRSSISSMSDIERSRAVQLRKYLSIQINVSFPLFRFLSFT